jgi:hypothetical protein
MSELEKLSYIFIKGNMPLMYSSKKFNILGCNSAATPDEAGIKLRKDIE